MNGHFHSLIHFFVHSFISPFVNLIKNHLIKNPFFIYLFIYVYAKEEKKEENDLQGIKNNLFVLLFCFFLLPYIYIFLPFHFIPTKGGWNKEEWGKYGILLQTFFYIFPAFPIILQNVEWSKEEWEKYWIFFTSFIRMRSFPPCLFENNYYLGLKYLLKLDYICYVRFYNLCDIYHWFKFYVEKNIKNSPGKYTGKLSMFEKGWDSNYNRKNSNQRFQSLISIGSSLTRDV